MSSKKSAVPKLTNSPKLSLSGSETDVSTSNENLSPEERHVLRTTKRQDPQGEETFLASSPATDKSTNNTLIIHHNKSLDGGLYSVSPFFYGAYNCTANDNSSPVNSDKSNSKMQTQIQAEPKQLSTNLALHRIGQNQNILVRNASSPSIQLSSSRTSSSESVQTSPSPFNKVFFHLSTNDNSNNNIVADNYTELQQPMLENYLNSLSNWKSSNRNSYCDVLKHLPPPPEYERTWNNESPSSASTSASTSTTPESKSVERLSLSRSHPDLSKLDDENATRDAKIIEMILNGNSSGDVKRIIEMLTAENIALKNELEMYFKKVSKLQKFEMEIQKVHQSHEELMRSSEKKEKLERAIRYKLEIDIKRLQEQNKLLKEQLDSAIDHVSKRPISDILDDRELSKEIGKREVLIAQLLTQNKELLNDKERQEIELQAQRLTLQEQRNHIDILDTALMSAQNNVLKLETELRKKQAYEERANHLQKALANLQLASERRLQMEKRVRTHLEKEIETLKKQFLGGRNSGNGKSDKEVDDMKLTIREYEEKLILLEAEVAKWEQKYLEESTMRQIEVNAASAPKDAKIAALEKTSQESEKLIAEARTERLKHMDELHDANKKCTELESRIKDLESKLAEKDAMIKVLQQHSRDKDEALQKTVFAQRAPTGRHIRSASTMGLTNSNISNSGSLAGCANSSSVAMKSTKEESTINETQLHDVNASGSDANSTIKNLDEQLKELDSRLTNKDSIIRALRSEKERYPNHYNNWRL